MNLGHAIHRAARRHGGRVAVRAGSESVTFAELGERIGSLGHALRQAGLRPGDRVLDLQRNSVTYVETDLALAAAGLCRVALNYRQAPADWAKVAADCAPRALIYAGEFADSAADLRAGVDVSICVDDGADDVDLRRFARASSGRRAELDFDADTLVSLNYSSGTSGAPKGSRRTHRNRFAGVGNMVTDVFLGLPAPDDVWCHTAPMTHASGLFVLPHFLFGAEQVVLPGFDPGEFMETVERFGVTGSVLVPTMVARLLRDDASRPGLPGLRRLVYAGAPMSAAHVREAFDRLTPELVNMYGMVEAVPPVSILGQADHRVAIAEDKDWLASCGSVCTGVAVSIRDDRGGEAAPGELGEVFIAGDNVMSGYWGDHDDSDVKGVRDGWLRTGDGGYLDDGRLYLVDRKGDMVITGGYNVYPSEVEAVVRDVDGVREAVVLGVPDPEWGQVVTAVYVGEPGLEAAIQELCRARLAGYKKPRAVRRVESLPVNHNGKVSRRDVAALLASLPTT